VVKKILRGYKRAETKRIIAFRSHWGYQSEYYNPASGNEKGGVEGEPGWFRRNWLVPVPEATALEALNEHITYSGCLPGEPTAHHHRTTHHGWWGMCGRRGKGVPNGESRRKAWKRCRCQWERSLLS
jgi:hypothetical protein